MPLDSLPTELLELVASHFDLPTFCSFRLTASYYSSKTTHNFKERFFTTQQLQWTRSSLQRLTDISGHPEFGDALQVLVIDATPRYALPLWKMRHRSADAGHMTPIADDEDGDKLTQRLNYELEELQEEANEMAKWFSETRFDVKCLTAVFSSLHSLESVIFSYTGMDPRFSKFSRRYCETSQHEMSRPFISTLSALAVSAARVKHLNMHAEGMYGAISIGRIESLAPLLRAFDEVFSQLETLHLNLRDWRSPDSGFVVERTRAPFIVRFLAKCAHLKTLHLSCHSDLEDDLFGEMARTCRFSSLESCKLEHFRINRASDLLAFLAPSSACLGSLELKHLLLADPMASWAYLFTSFADSQTCLMGLQILLMNKLFVQQPSGIVNCVRFYDWGRPGYTLRFESWNWRVECRERGCKHIVPGTPRWWDAGATWYPFTGMDSLLRSL